MPDTQNLKVSKHSFDDVEKRLDAIKFDQGTDKCLLGDGTYGQLPTGGIQYDDTDIKNDLQDLTGRVDTVEAGLVKIGDVDTLNTTAKDTVVNAVNELDGKITNIQQNGYDDTDIKNSIGTLTDLTTVEQNSLVGAINELDADKVDKTELDNKANTADVYLKTETYSRDEVDASLLAKADTTDLDAYTTTDDMNLLLDEKADKTQLVGLATEVYVQDRINEAALNAGGQVIDLSIYQTKDKVGENTDLITTEQNTIVGAINEVKALADGKADTTELEAHTQDLDIHVTADEKLAWNDKQEKITGTKGQYIGFDDAGEAVAVELELNRNPYGIVDGWLPEGSVVDFREKEIRILCPATAQWVKTGGGDADKCYIGIKAYAPTEAVMKFKEDWGHPIVDQTMWELTDEDAGTGVDPDGRRYSVFWIPAATLNVDGVTWDYTGKDSAEGDFKGRDYAVEWYTADDKLVASDHIRINFSNENCHASVLPFYSGELGGGGATQTIEDAVIEGSDNPVKSDALYKEFAKKKDADVVVNCMCASTGFSGLTFTSKDKTFTEINDLIVTEKKTVVVELTDTTTTSKYILYYRGANNRLDGGIFTNTNSHDFYGSAKIDGVEKTIILKVNSDDSAVLELSANRYVQLFVDCASGGGTFGLMGNLDKTFEEISKEFHAKNIVEVIAWDNTTMTSCLLSIAYVGADLIKFTGIGDFDGVTKRIVLTIDNQNNQNLEAVDIGGATIEFDDEPLQGSENAVKSGGVFTSIESVKTYSDEKLEEANTYSDNVLSDAKIYSDEKLVEAKTYSDQKLIEANQYTDTAVANLVDSAPETMNTLKEVAEAIEQNETVVEALTQAIGNKQDKITGTQGQIVGIGTDGNTTVIDGKLIDTLEYTPSSDDGGNNVLKIILTNGTSQSFNIKNGSKGNTGATGATGSISKTSFTATSTNASSTSYLGIAKYDDTKNMIVFIDGVAASNAVQKKYFHSNYVGQNKWNASQEPSGSGTYVQWWCLPYNNGGYNGKKITFCYI